MARGFGDSVLGVSSTTGTSNFTVSASRVDGYFTFGESHAVGDTFEYAAVAGNQVEIGTGTLLSPTSISRVVIRSTNNNQKVNFSTPPKVFETISGTTFAKFLNEDDALDVSQLTTLSGTQSGDMVLMYRPSSNTLHTLLAANLGGSTAPDTTAPTLTSPTGASTGTTTYNGSVTTNEANGTLRYLATVNATESVATVKANGASLAVTSTGSKAVSGSGLTQATQYYLHFVHTDAAGNDSARVTSAPFTTAAAGDTTAPTLSAPSATKTGSTTATGSVTTNEANGTLYRYASTNAAESAATVKAANLTQAVTATGAQAVSFTGLTPGMTLYPHYLHRDAAGNDSAVASGASFVTDSANTAPAAPTIGTAVAGDSYVDVYFTLNGNGGSPITSITATLSTGESATGTTSPIRVPASNGTARTASVTATNNVGTSPASGQSNSVTPMAVVAYTIVGNTVSGSPNKPYATLSAANADADYGTRKRWGNSKQSPSLYYTITPTPASAVAGWGDSPTEPPPTVTPSQNTNGSSSLNGMVPMSHPSSWGNLANLYAAVGDRKYYWVKPVDGAPFCVDTNGTLITT